MSPALLASLFAILGVGLAVVSAACVMLWRRVRLLTPVAARPALSVDLQGYAGGPPTLDAPAAATPAVRSGPPSKVRYEVARRLDDLAGRHRALEARLARIEASATEAAVAIASHPAGPRSVRRVDRGGPTLIAVPNLAAPPNPASQAASELDRRFGAVWALADSGAPAEAVARETGYPIGQVELILGLRRQLLTAEAGPDV